MQRFIETVIDGIATGSIYAALALAIVLVNQATGLINFAQGGMAVLAAYFAYSFLQWGVPLVLAILLSMLASFVLGAIIERFLMRRFDFPVAPAVIGLILGPLAEQQLRRALAISQGDYTIFVTRPISAALLAVAAVALLGPLVARLIIRRRAAGAGAAVSAGQ